MVRRLTGARASHSVPGPQPIPVTAVPWLTRKSFGLLPDGRPVDMYVLSSRTVEVTCITYGGIIVSLRVPDRDGRWSDVVLGYPTLEPYLTNDSYLGAVIGRYANRIAGGRFVLGGVSYQLATNDGANHLHGGARGLRSAPLDGRRRRCCPTPLVSP